MSKMNVKSSVMSGKLTLSVDIYAENMYTITCRSKATKEAYSWERGENK